MTQKDLTYKGREFTTDAVILDENEKSRVVKVRMWVNPNDITVRKQCFTCTKNCYGKMICEKCKSMRDLCDDWLPNETALNAGSKKAEGRVLHPDFIKWRVAYSSELKYNYAKCVAAQQEQANNEKIGRQTPESIIALAKRTLHGFVDYVQKEYLRATGGPLTIEL